MELCPTPAKPSVPFLTAELFFKFLDLGPLSGPLLQLIRKCSIPDEQVKL